MALDVAFTGEVDRTLPHAETDGTDIDMRIGRYRELYTLNLVPTVHTLADEGSYLVATSGNPGTGLAFPVAATISETAGYFLNILNNDRAGAADAQRLYLHYIRLICTVAPASATSGHFFLKTDSISRYASGGSALAALAPNTDSSSLSVAVINAGSLTTVAAGQSARLLARGVLRTAVPVVFDEWVFQFGATDGPGSVQLAGAAAQRMVIPCPPVILGPQSNLGLQLWFPANATTGLSAEIEIGWWER